MSSGLSILEIFSNPYDLEIMAGESKGTPGKFHVAICRGPGHQFKPLISLTEPVGSLEEAVSIVGVILRKAYDTGMVVLADKENPISQILNPEGLPVDQLEVLNPDLVNRIIEELRQHQVASTYKMPKPASAG